LPCYTALKVGPLAGALALGSPAPVEPRLRRVPPAARAATVTKAKAAAHPRTMAAIIPDENGPSDVEPDSVLDNGGESRAPFGVDDTD
jgi:hypothetical protein